MSLLQRIKWLKDSGSQHYSEARGCEDMRTMFLTDLAITTKGFKQA